MSISLLLNVSFIYTFLYPKRKIYLYIYLVLYAAYGFVAYTFLYLDLPSGFSITYYSKVNYYFLIPMLLIMILVQNIFIIPDELKVRFPTLTKMHLFCTLQVFYTSICLSSMLLIIGIMSILLFQQSLEIAHLVNLFIQVGLFFFILSHIGLLSAILQKYLSSILSFFIIYSFFMLDFHSFSSVVGQFIGFDYTLDLQPKEIVILFIRNIALFLILFAVSNFRTGGERN